MKVLLVIDAQNCYAPGGAFPVVGWADSQANIEKLLAGWDGKVIFFRHEAAGTPFDPSHPSSQLSLEHGNWPVVVKRFASCYTDTDLGEMLRDLKESLPTADRSLEIYGCGYQSGHCVLTTALESAAHGESFVISEACGNPDRGDLDGETIHRAAMYMAAMFYVQPISVDEALKRA
jgi:nicotinamidase-related amidase